MKVAIHRVTVRESMTKDKWDDFRLMMGDHTTYELTIEQMAMWDLFKKEES